MTPDRILRHRGGETVDEIVLSGVDIHVEELSHRSYYLGVYRGDAVVLQGYFSAAGRPVRIDFTVVEDEVAWTKDEEHQA